MVTLRRLRNNMPRANLVDLLLLLCIQSLCRLTSRQMSFFNQGRCSHFPVRSFHTGLPLSSRNIKVSVPLTISRARITSAPSW